MEILEALKEGVKLPLMSAGLRLGDGICIVYVNAKPEPRLRQFFDAMPAQDLPIWLNSIAIHEMTHCIEQRADGQQWRKRADRWRRQRNLCCRDRRFHR